MDDNDGRGDEMRRRGWIVGALALLALLVVQGAAADQSYADPAGDATGGAPDVTTVAVANDGAGKITFDITVAGLPAPDTFVDVPMNTDLNPSTGDEGIDHEFFFSGSQGIGLLLRWNGSELVPVVVPTFRSSYANGVVHLEVNRADIGNTSGFAFWVSSLKVSGNQVVGFDDAPDGTAVYQYALAQHPACSDKIDNDGDGKVGRAGGSGVHVRDGHRRDRSAASAASPEAVRGQARRDGGVGEGRQGLYGGDDGDAQRRQAVRGSGHLQGEGRRDDAEGGRSGCGRNGTLHDAAARDGEAQAADRVDHRYGGNGQRREAVHVRDSLKNRAGPGR